MAVTLKTGTDRAAGVEMSETPTATWKTLYAVRVRLVTSAAVATRTLTLVIDDGANILWQKIAPATQTASLTRDYVFVLPPYTDAGAFDANNQIVLTLPAIPMLPGHRIRTLTTNLQAGDDFGAPLLLLNEVGYNEEVVNAF